MNRLPVVLFLAGALIGATQHRFQPFDVPRGAFLQDLSFSRDGRLYATIANDHGRAIVSSKLESGSWSTPKTTAFSGHWQDLEEILSPDGSTLVFASNRPTDGSSRPIDAFWGGKKRPGQGGNLWEVKRQGDGWSTPVRLPNTVNENTSTFSPALARDGTLYFMQASGPNTTFHLFISKFEHGSYQRKHMAPFSDPRYSDFDPAVAADDSFVVFVSTRPPAKPGTADLFIAYHDGDQWTAPVDIAGSTDPDGDAIEPRLSLDAKTLYYTAGTPRELRTVDLGFNRPFAPHHDDDQ